MKNKFIEYHIVDHLEEIYNDSIIVLDTNAMLNFYRYSEKTRGKYKEILSVVKDRLFITHNICSEFYRNRHNLIKNRSQFKNDVNAFLIDNQTKLANIIENSSSGSKYDTALAILKHEERLQNKLISIIKKSSDKIKKELDEFVEKISLDYIKGKDPILADVVELFTDKISEEIGEKEMEEILKEGESRYKNNIPPGFKDNAKESPEKFGDFIIWKEMQKLSIDKNKNILFVSDDRKEDWALKISGMDLGPRKDLIKEFNKITNHLFFSITTKEFITLISENFKIKNIESLENETDLIQEIEFDNLKIQSKKLSKLLKKQSIDWSTLDSSKELIDNNFNNIGQESIFNYQDQKIIKNSNQNHKSSIVRNYFENYLRKNNLNRNSVIITSEVKRDFIRTIKNNRDFTSLFSDKYELFAFTDLIIQEFFYLD